MIQEQLPGTSREEGKMHRMFVLSTFLLFAVFTAEAAADEAAGEPQTYTVQRGDRFATLSERFGATPEEIRAANPGAYGTLCGNPHKVTLGDGTVRAICGRPRYYLIAGKTLVIPAPRLIIESENVRLEAENTALEAERDQARAERDSAENELDALRSERDRLLARNEEFRRSGQELQDRYDELKRDVANRPSVPPSRELAKGAETPAPANGSAEEQNVWSWRVMLVILAAIVLFIVYVVQRYRYFNAVDGSTSGQTAAEDRWKQEERDLAERRQKIKDAEQAIRDEKSALDREREDLRTKRDELVRWEENLKDRETKPVPEKPRVPTTVGVPPIFPPVPPAAAKAKAEAGLLQAFVSRGLQLIAEEQARLDAARQRLGEEAKTLAGREAACTLREKALEQKAGALQALQQGLEGRERELAEKERGVEALRQSFSGQKARTELGEVRHDQREHDLAQGFSDLAKQREQLHREIAGERDKLDRLRAEVEGNIRMYDQDIAPEITRQRGELAEREAQLNEREALIAEAKADNDRRAEALTAEEQKYERKLQDFERFKDEVNARAEQVAAGEQKLLEGETELKNNREAFADEVDAAKSTLARAKKKKASVEALDRRESEVKAREEAVTAREGTCDTREGALQAWEEGLVARERGIDLTGLSKSKGPHRPTLPPPFAPPIARFSPDASAGDDENPTVTFPQPEEVDPRGTTHIDADPGPTQTVESVDIEGEREIGSGESLAPAAEPGAPDTCVREDGRSVELGSPEAHQGVCRPEPDPEKSAHEDSGIYCNACHAIVAITQEEFLEHQKTHQPDILQKDGELPESSQSQYVCPCCGAQIPWEEMDGHDCEAKPAPK